jgi:hypothetical protein
MITSGPWHSMQYAVIASLYGSKEDLVMALKLVSEVLHLVQVFV